MPCTRTIDVRKQKKLSLRKCFDLVCSGIAHRLLRSGLTMSVILLAVAFFMSMLSESMFVASVADEVAARAARQREAAQLLGFLYNRPTTQHLSARLARHHGDPEQLAQFAAIANRELPELHAIAEIASWEQTYLRFFKDLGVGKRLILVGKQEGRDIFRNLSDTTEFLDFSARLEPLKSLKLPGGTNRFQTFLQQFADYEARLTALAADWETTVDTLDTNTRRLTGNQTLERWLCTASHEQLELWRHTATELGFVITDQTLARMREQLNLTNLRRDIERQLNSPEKKTQWKHVFRERATLDQKLMRLTDPSVAELLDNQFTPEQLDQVQRLFTTERRLAKVEKRLASKNETRNGSILSGRQIFLLVISFVVCMVGIANAMLMAITERFREIATMKCLGATDGYILTQFMMEASIQGLAGGLLGMLIGFALATLKSSALYGRYLYADFPVGSVLVCGIISLLIGIVLAALASLYPSWAASRMAPMEAMRVE